MFDRGDPPAAAIRRRQFGPVVFATALLLALHPFTGMARTPAGDTTGVPGVAPSQLEARFWTGRMDRPDSPVLDRDGTEALNARLFAEDRSMHSLEAIPDTLPGEDVRIRVSSASPAPARALFTAGGRAFEGTPALVEQLALPRIPAEVAVRHGLVVKRADMRTFPTDTRVFSDPDDVDIDRFQETALFPGTPLALLHESADGEWWFAVSPRYQAWIRKSNVAVGSRAAVLGYLRRAPYLVVTGATVRTVHTPEEPRVSDLQLDMGVRVPVLDDWPADRPVNGQAAYLGHVVELPVRDAEGRLAFAPALVPRSADVSTDYLPYTPANLVEQAFKFLGERYGWGHAYNARDCSGFVSEVYRSVGLQLPRNTSAQGVSPVYQTIRFSDADTHEARVGVLRTLQPGDLVYIPGHVMMVIGQQDGAPYVIHDVTGISVRDPDDTLRRIVLNGVSVTPLLPLQSGEDATLVDRIYSIQRIRPRDSGPAPDQDRP
ncbi:SH3 domain-containing protein [Lysobacter sp. SG-8]|uniref:SH3 domain-containing protein n=1 Tax=Marilutibacter penaei TaxID=2759900 RepID=A0A7W3U2N7_9GAMM|nr:SH3 domain-containing protein [Lysobacter penaei]MBB1087505.1 SH3 domain-containing protein [Lysobacter penaei]